jgi:cytosine deaminase
LTGHWITPPDASRYVLADVRVPQALCAVRTADDGWCRVDVLIDGSDIAAVGPNNADHGETPVVACAGAVLLSGLVDCHTHLDKAHVAAFADFPAGDLANAISAMAQNKETWTPDSLTRRVNFSLKTAYANGVRAMRSHVDFSPDMPEFIWDVMHNAVAHWADRIDLQLVALANISYMEDPGFAQSMYNTASRFGRIGLFLFNQPGMASLLKQVFERAKTEGWDVDLHVDEGLDTALDGLNVVTKVVQAAGYDGTVLCGHCAALGSYDPARRARVIDRAQAAGLHFVALPTTNLFLQGRDGSGAENMRGMAPVAALTSAGANVSFGADNVRDAFCAFGDFDPMAVLNLGAHIGHLAEPARDWAQLVTRNPANTLGLAWDGIIARGAPADLVLFSGRNSSEISARTSPDRVVIRAGRWITDAIPDFRELNE